MTDVVEKTGKSVEEAVRSALEELGCSREGAVIEILAEPSKGLWGIIGSKEAKVRVHRKAVSTASGLGSSPVDAPWEKAKAQEPQAEVGAEAPPQAPASDGAAGPGDVDKTIRFITEVTTLMGIEAEVDKKETEETVHYTLNGPRMGMVIGRRGETLDALQYLSNIVAGRDRDLPRKRIIVDAEDYRSRREETLVRLASRLAAKAKKSGRRVVLEPMNPQERRVIHTALEKDPDVKSISEGEDPFRRLVIYPVGGEGRRDGESRYARNSGGGGRYGRGGGEDD